MSLLNKVSKWRDARWFNWSWQSLAFQRLTCLPSLLQLRRYASAAPVLLAGGGRRAAIHLLLAIRQRHHVLHRRAGAAGRRAHVLPGQGGRPAQAGAGTESRAASQWQRCWRSPGSVYRLEPVLHAVPHGEHQPPQRRHQLRQHCLRLDRHLSGVKLRLTNHYFQLHWTDLIMFLDGCLREVLM